MKLEHLTDDELREIALQRNSRGRYTSDAIRAQTILYNRNHWCDRPSKYTQVEQWDGSRDNMHRILEGE